MWFFGVTMARAVWGPRASCTRSSHRTESSVGRRTSILPEGVRSPGFWSLIGHQLSGTLVNIPWCLWASVSSYVKWWDRILWTLRQRHSTHASSYTPIPMGSDVCLWPRDHSGIHRPAGPALLFFSKILCDHLRKKIRRMFTLKVYDRLEFPVHVFLLVEERRSEIAKKAERWAGSGGKET